MSSDARDPSLWNAENLRLTAFLAEPLANTDQTWWEELVGQPPENTNFQAKRTVRQDDGPFENGRLILAINPARVDWLNVPLVEAEKLLESFPSVGPLPAALDTFLPAMVRWLAVAPRIQRMAFGAILSQPAADHKSGYELLGSYLPFVKVDPESSDFSLQVNRKRASNLEIPGLILNRLSKWSAAKMSLQLSGGSDKSVTASELFACRVELDISTVADFQDDLPRERLAEVFQELVELGREIASKGDTK